jgi:hypothetical protein
MHRTMMHVAQHDALPKFINDCIERLARRLAQGKRLCSRFPVVKMQGGPRAADCTPVVLPDPAYPLFGPLINAKA